MATYDVSPELNKIIKEYAERLGISTDEAHARLIKTAHSRKASLTKYANKNRKAAPKAKKAPKAKAKGALARKQATAKPKAKKVKAAKPRIAVAVADESAPQAEAASL